MLCIASAAKDIFFVNAASVDCEESHLFLILVSVVLRCHAPQMRHRLPSVLDTRIGERPQYIQVSDQSFLAIDALLLFISIHAPAVFAEHGFAVQHTKVCA
jgi:hypothetical protein